MLEKNFNFFARVKGAIRYIKRGDLNGFLGRIKFYLKQKNTQKIYSKLASNDGDVWGILTTPHTIYVAKIIAERLAIHGIQSEIITGSPDAYHHKLYIILCAQMFETLPPPERRIIFQLEQSVSSRWFTKNYLDALENSLAVMEYSLKNIEFLAGKGIRYPHIHYLPIGGSLKSPEILSGSTKEYDFIFYGDSLSSPRRRKLLKALQNKFSVKIVNDVFGDEMSALIRKARAVINIHYYEDALLEMPRIQECISLGIPILSESTADQCEYPELNGAVHFFRQGSEADMLQCASDMINNLSVTSDNLVKAAAVSSQRFTFMFDRFLVAIGVLPASAILATPVYIEHNSDFIGLSLPETIERRNIFTNNKPKNCVVFDGVRNSRSWIGCGSSFSALARYALTNGIDQLTVIEDDALLPDDYEKNISITKEYLESREENWDIFSGLMASVHPSAKVLSVEKWKGMTFLTLDRMTSTVCNIYSKRALGLLAKWDPMDLNVDTNTIDRYLEGQDELRVVVALPFLAGHREEVSSTLWGFENSRYAPMIAEAESRLRELEDEWMSHTSQN